MFLVAFFVNGILVEEDYDARLAVGKTPHIRFTMTEPCLVPAPCLIDIDVCSFMESR